MATCPAASPAVDNWEEHDVEVDIDRATGRKRGRRDRAAAAAEAAELAADLADVAGLNRLGIRDIDGIVIRDLIDVSCLDEAEDLQDPDLEG